VLQNPARKFVNKYLKMHDPISLKNNQFIKNEAAQVIASIQYITIPFQRIIVMMPSKGCGKQMKSCMANAMRMDIRATTDGNCCNDSLTVFT
jgi:uncharacterized protein YrrD